MSLAGTPRADPSVPGDNYSTIEGGLGWWTGTRFGAEAPKFIMGGVARGFSEWANGPGAGAGSADVDRRDWSVPQGKYGVAQLSPYVLWAPDGLNLAADTNGELFGYGYHPLPIIDTQEQTGGQDLTTGDRSWTLFLNTTNFSGPVTFFIPNFFSKPALDDPAVEGAFFDANGTSADRWVGMETQVIPARYATDDAGHAWARVTRTQFPAADADSSIILHRVASYTDGALRDDVTDWFDGAAPAKPFFDPEETVFSPFDRIDTVDQSSYSFTFEGNNEDEEHLIDWSMLVEIDGSDAETFRYRWNLDWVERVDDRFVLPEYFRLVAGEGGNVWRPVDPVDVPRETGLADQVFDEVGRRNDTEPYTTPDGLDSIWRTPGPVAGPFRADLGDGSSITYSWYRFVDQPAIRSWGFTDEQLVAMQVRVEAMHREWGPNASFLAPPLVGELASLDPAVVVAPPPGLEAGYVPIVTRQEATMRVDPDVTATT